MIDIKYKVIKEISMNVAWQSGAKVGEILHVTKWGKYPSALTLLNNENKAVIDLDSPYRDECCEKIDNN
jgi:hypothetical protein